MDDISRYNISTEYKKIKINIMYLSSVFFFSELIENMPDVGTLLSKTISTKKEHLQIYISIRPYEIGLLFYRPIREKALVDLLFCLYYDNHEILVV